MITKEKVIEILEQHAYRSAAAGRIVVYESSFEDIAEELVKYCFVGRSEQLVCNHPNESWKFDESGVDMYCEECAKNE